MDNEKTYPLNKAENAPENPAAGVYAGPTPPSQAFGAVYAGPNMPPPPVFMTVYAGPAFFAGPMAAPDAGDTVENLMRFAQAYDAPALPQTNVPAPDKDARFCRECGAVLSADAKFCPECGTPAPPAAARCPGCGAERLPGAKFCSECGCLFPQDG